MIESINKTIKNRKQLLIIIRSILVFCLFWCIPFIPAIILMIFNINVESLSINTRILLSFSSSISMLIIYYFIYRKELKKEFKTFTSNFIENMDVGVKWWFLGLLIMVASNLFINLVLKGGGAGNEKVVQQMLNHMPLTTIINASIIAPFNEEIVFRKTIRDVFKNKWIFALLSFILFGGGHIVSNASTIVDYLYIIPYGALGATFALAYDETDTIFTSLSMHAIHNSILSIVSVFVLGQKI